VVATLRAAQGLSPDVEGLVETADSPAAMASKVVRLLLHPDSAGRQGLLARQRVAIEYRWDQALIRLLLLLRESVSAVATSST
jgi:hypothetical protein